jgi:hypothetical protein
MAKQRKRKVRLLTLAAVALLATLAAVGTGCAADDEAVSVECDSTREYFARYTIPVLFQNCLACHKKGGAASETEYVLKGPAEAGFLEHNLNSFAQVAKLESDGESIVLLKPTLAIPHEGGQLIQKDSDEYKSILGFVVRLKNDEVCEPNNTSYFTGVELANAEDTLRKASIILAGRLPNDGEITRVREGGFAALEAVLDELMTEEPFFDFVRQIYADLFGTDFYLNDGTDVLNAYNNVDEDGFFLGEGVDSAQTPYYNPSMNPFWHRTAPKQLMHQYGIRDAEEMERFSNIAVAREPLGLLEYIVRNDRPFTELVTADYMAVTPLSQHAYGAEGAEFVEGNNPFEWAAARMPDFPHSGLLTSQILWARHTTTLTNRNRHRARVILLWFLGTDILKTAEQPVDQTDVTVDNPQVFDPRCNVCHTTVDPIAGTLQSFDEMGLWWQEPQWYKEQWPPGLGDLSMPNTVREKGFQWLGQQIAVDDRFALSAVYNLYRGLTGRDPLVAPVEFNDPLHEYKFNGFLAQANTFRAIADKFKASNYNFKTVVKEFVLSPYFRAKNAVALSRELQAQLGEVGLGHLLTPEELHKKIMAVLGIPWGDASEPILVAQPRSPADQGVYQLFYGGVDNDQVAARIREPNGVMAAVAERMAIQMSCTAVPQDFARASDDRILFQDVTIGGVQYDPQTLEPETQGGLPIPDAKQAIMKTIVQLHEHILGERLSVDDVEVERTYSLFLETWREGKDKMANDELGTNLPYRCQATEDPWTYQPYTDEESVVEDPKYVIRAWMAVGTYLISDFKFLFE